jgi:hypothetical protein
MSEAKRAIVRKGRRKNAPAKKRERENMKTYLSVGIIAASLALTNLAAAHGGGGGGHFGGGGSGGGGHFGGGGMHFFAPAAHFSAPAATGRPTFAAGDRHHFGHRPAFFSEFWPSSEYYYGDSDYADSGTDYSTPDDDTGSDSTVVAVQKALARGGYYHGPIDGTLDLTTQDAIARYDRDHRLPVSHAINQQLLNSLRLG